VSGVKAVPKAPATEKVYVAMDDATCLADSEARPDHQTKTTVGFLVRTWLVF